MIHHFTPVPRGAHSSAAIRALPATLLALAALTGLSSATVTPYCWIRAGESGLMADASGLNHNFNAAFSSLGGGNPAAIVVPNGVGGPLGKTSAISSASTRWGSFGVANAGMWIQGPNNSVPAPELWGLPPTNWCMEAWVLPVGTGASGGGSGSQLVSTGSGQFGGAAGGAAFKLSYNFDDTYTLTAVDIGLAGTPIGNPIVVDNGTWTHLAVVNVDGTATFYVNGAVNGDPLQNASAPSGVPYIGSGQDTGQPFDGYLDEIRYSTFQPGQFQVNDLFARPLGPNIITQPETASVWTGGAAPFEVTAVFDAATTYQWKLGPNDIPNATASEYYIPSVAAADSGKVFSVLVTSHGVNLASNNATLTVVPVEVANVNFYRAAVQAETSLRAFFPADGDTGTTLSNEKDAGFNATLHAGASWDGRTTRSYGRRALRLKGTSEAAIPANPAYEFAAASGGTIEGIVYMATGAPPGNQTIFSVAAGNATAYYQVQASPDGNSLLFKNGAMAQPISWTVVPTMLGRRTHVAMVFGTDSTITAYADGVSLGSKPHPGYGSPNGLGANIGSSGAGEAGWNGTIDELAIYGSPLSANTIAIHNSRFVFGTAVTAPVIESQSTGTRNLLAGGAPVLTVKANGTAPLSYQWKRNNAAIQNNPSATTPTLVLDNSTVGMSGDYTVTVTNPVGNDVSDPVTINFTAPPDLYASYVLADNPSAYWRLNEAAGNTVLKDSAGGLDGTYASTVVRGVPGAPGTQDNAAQFSGAGTPVPNASVPYTPILNPSTPFTVEFWAKPDISGQSSRAVLGTQNRNADRSGYAVYQGFNLAAWEAHLGWTNTVLFIQGQVPPEAGRWDHVAVTWDGNTVSRIFVNGVDDTSAGSSVNGPHRTNLVQPFEIGSRFNGTVPYQGVIDEVAFYNHVLSPERIALHASIATAPPPAPIMNPPSYANGNVTLTWITPANFVLQESTDGVTWTTVQGAVSGYTTPVTRRKLYRVAQP